MSTVKHLSAADSASSQITQQSLAGAFISITSDRKSVAFQVRPSTVADVSDWNTIYRANRENQFKTIIDSDSFYSQLDVSANQVISQIKQFNAKIQSLRATQSEWVAKSSNSPASAPTPAQATSPASVSVYRRSLCVH